jgi:hypothetical protein
MDREINERVRTGCYKSIQPTGFEQNYSTVPHNFLVYFNIKQNLITGC